MTTIALMTDLWPSRPEPHAGRFVEREVAAIGAGFRYVVLVPKLLAAPIHRRIWGSAVQGWQRDHVRPAQPHRLLAYPSLRVPKRGEAAARALGARAALSLARERPRLVHGHFLLHVGPAAVRVAQALGVPSVVTAHGTDARWLFEGGTRPRLREEMRWACMTADRVVAVSNPIADGLRAVGVPTERLEVIPMGVDPDVFLIRDRAAARRQLELDPELPVALFAGRLTVEKGALVLAEAVSLLREQGQPVECVAAGPAAGGPEGIRLLGVQDAERLALWMSAADVVCLPSFAEGSPVAVIEALACGTPVVATRVGGIPEQVRSGENGLLVEPGDVPGLRDALAEALRRVWPRDEIRRSSEPFWLERTAARLEALYSGLLA